MKGHINDINYYSKYYGIENRNNTDENNNSFEAYKEELSVIEKTNVTRTQSDSSEDTKTIPTIDVIYQKLIELISILIGKINDFLKNNSTNSIGYLNSVQIKELRTLCEDYDPIFWSVNMKINDNTNNEEGNSINYNENSEAESIIAIIISQSKKPITLDGAKKLVNFQNLISSSTNEEINKYINDQFEDFILFFQSIADN